MTKRNLNPSICVTISHGDRKEYGDDEMKECIKVKCKVVVEDV